MFKLDVYSPPSPQHDRNWGAEIGRERLSTDIGALLQER